MQDPPCSDEPGETLPKFQPQGAYRRAEAMKRKEIDMVRSQKQSWKAFILLMALLTVLATGCRVRQTEEGELPDVDVSTEGGKLPEYDVDAADVDVKTEKREIEVPTDVDVNMPGEKADDKNEEDRPPEP
jgi:hypothetical protein